MAATEARDGTPPSPVRTLLPLLVPALAIGAASSIILLGVSELADQLQHFLWTYLPRAFAVSAASAGWTVGVLTAVGVASGLLVRLVPGHAGPDPATTSLVGPPLKLSVLPGLLGAAVLTLAGGVSLGPENPITATCLALATAFGRRIAPASPAQVWIGLGVAGIIGAMFGTPVAAALLLSEMPVKGEAAARPLWDRLFAPLLAAGAGALTTVLVANPTFTIELPGYRGFHVVDVLSGSLVALAAAALGLAAVYAFPLVHRAFGALRHPVVQMAVGGLLLGLLGALGGHLTLFKGLDEIKELAIGRTGHSTGNLVLLAVVKLVALLVAGSCGFRGGRIFPAVFVGVALGLAVNSGIPAVPAALAVGAALLGILLATTRQGWLSLFLAITVIGDIRLLPVLCVTMLPAWLLVTGRPEMTLKPEPTPAG